MARLALSPYYHPTTVCFVDDNQSFLRSLELEIPDDWNYYGFVEPEQALAFLQQPPQLPPLVDRCFALENRAAADPIIHFELSRIEQEINELARFDRISVAVIDYAMPTMNGLELCAALTDPYLQKAMLTGVADEKIAVAAFNDGLIHQFAAKHRLASAQQILAFVDALKHRYFSQHTAQLSNNLALNPPQFLLDETIAIEVRRLMSSRNLIEYYLVTDPPGLLFLNAAGELCRLLILSAADLAAQVDFAKAHHAPEPVIAQLTTGSCIGFFWDTPDNYFGAEVYPWQEHLLPASTIAGDQTWFLALAEDPPTDIDFDPAKSSFNAYLAQSRDRFPQADR